MHIERPSVVFVDDEPAIHEHLSELLDAEGFAVRSYLSAAEAVSVFATHDDARGFAGAVLTDLDLPGELDGLGLMERIHAADAKIPVLLLTGYGTIDIAVEAMKRGAYDFVTKPPESSDRLVGILRQACQRRAEILEQRRMTGAAQGLLAATIVGHDPAIARQRENICRYAPHRTSVLLRGETGTGKELVARAVHSASGRHDGPFVAVNCGALTPELIEKTVFGHVRGAFSGAVDDRPGLFERAHGGTLFLDEIGDLPMAAQATFLRILEDGEVTRVGDGRARQMDVRIVAATHRDLEAMMAAERFRPDLYHRINGVTLWLPPLRERSGDIIRLFEYFLRQEWVAVEQAYPELSAADRRALVSYGWPGNVRELRKAAQHFAIWEGNEGVDHAIRMAGYRVAGEEGPEKRSWTAIERDLRERVLRQRLLIHSGNMKRVAEELGLKDRTLRQWCSDLRINRRDYLDS